MTVRFRLLVLCICLLLLSGFLVLPAAANGGSPRIVVHVTDQFGAPYDMVFVEVWHQLFLVDNGTTLAGHWTSMTLPPNSDYIVKLYGDGSKAVSQVTVGTADLSLNFILTRPIPPDLTVQKITILPEPVAPGNAFIVEFEIATMNEATAYDAALGIDLTPPFSITGTGSSVPVGTIGANSSRTLDVKLLVAVSAVKGDYPLRFNLNYSDTLYHRYTFRGVFSVEVSGAPVIKVGSIQIRDTPLKPGLDTVLTLSLINVGNDRAFNTAIVLSGHANFLSNSTNLLGEIPLGAVVNSTFFIRVPPDTVPGRYAFDITLVYQDFLGRSYVTQTPSELSVVAWSPPDMSITNVLIDPPVLSTGTQGSITVFLDNFGTTEARNVEITISGAPGIFASSSFGVGTIESSGKATQVLGINVDPNLKPGTYNILLNASYTDPVGRAYSTSLPFEIRIYQSLNIFSPLNLLIIAYVGVLALLAFFVVRKLGWV